MFQWVTSSDRNARYSIEQGQTGLDRLYRLCGVGLHRSARLSDIKHDGHRELGSV
jgi:hypothetical protein